MSSKQSTKPRSSKAGAFVLGAAGLVCLGFGAYALVALQAGAVAVPLVVLGVAAIVMAAFFDRLTGLIKFGPSGVQINLDDPGPSQGNGSGPTPTGKEKVGKHGDSIVPLEGATANIFDSEAKSSPGATQISISISQQPPEVAKPPKQNESQIETPPRERPTRREASSAVRAERQSQPLTVRVEWERLDKLGTLQDDLREAITAYIETGQLQMDCVRLRARLESARKDNPPFSRMDWAFVRDALEGYRTETVSKQRKELAGFLKHLGKAMSSVAAMARASNDPSAGQDSIRGLFDAIDGMIDEAGIFDANCRDRSTRALDQIGYTVRDILRAVPEESRASRENNRAVQAGGSGAQ